MLGILGALIQWPTLLTLLMAPVLVFTYYRLARREDGDERVRQVDKETQDDGFVFVLVAVSVSIIAALLMKNVRLEEASSAETTAPVEEGKRDRESLVAAAALVYLSHRIESANRSSPHLMRTASKLISPDGDNSERALALRANEEVVKPLSQVILLNYLRQKNTEAATREEVNL